MTDMRRDNPPEEIKLVSWVAGAIRVPAVILLVLIGGVLLLAAAGGTPSAPTWAGAGMLHLVVALALRGAYARPKSLRIDRAGRSFVLVCLDGSSVAIPRSVVARASVVERVSYDTSSRLHSRSVRFVAQLVKRDLGTLDLTGFPTAAAANELVTKINAALDAMGDGPVAPVDVSSALAGVPGLDVNVDATAGGYRDGAPGALALAWSASVPWQSLATSFLAPLGVTLLVYGWESGRSLGATPWITLVFGILTLLAIGTTFRSVGARFRVALDARALRVERLRGDRAVEGVAIPLGAVRAVDASPGVSHPGPTLTIRVDPSQLQGAALPKDGGWGVVLGGGGSWVTVPMPRLRLADAIRIDLALSDAVARRSDQDAATV